VGPISLVISETEICPVPLDQSATSDGRHAYTLVIIAMDQDATADHREPHRTCVACGRRERVEGDNK